MFTSTTKQKSRGGSKNNQGARYTNILIGRHNSNPTMVSYQHWAAKYCEETGEGYYLSGISDLKWIYHYANL